MKFSNLSELTTAISSVYDDDSGHLCADSKIHGQPWRGMKCTMITASTSKITVSVRYPRIVSLIYYCSLYFYICYVPSRLYLFRLFSFKLILFKRNGLNGLKCHRMPSPSKLLSKHSVIF